MASPFNPIPRVLRITSLMSRGGAVIGRWLRSLPQPCWRNCGNPSNGLDVARRGQKRIWPDRRKPGRRLDEYTVKPVAVPNMGRVEERRGSLGHTATPRFPSPLIEPDVPISSIQLSGWLHINAIGGGTCTLRSLNGAIWASRGHSMLPSYLRLDVELSLKAPDLSGVSRLIANRLILAFLKSVPEVRRLSSTGITQLRQYYAPVRLPYSPPSAGV